MTPEQDALHARLLNVGHPSADVSIQAAEMIRSLAGEIERLRTENADLFKTNGEIANTIGADALRVRAALKKATDALKDACKGSNWHIEEDLLLECDAALAALADEQLTKDST